jgi:predicted NAD/FAD-binding protein
MKKIIIIGSGISGLTLANKLKDYFEVLVLECKFFQNKFKAQSTIGGRTETITNFSTNISIGGIYNFLIKSNVEPFIRFKQYFF